MAGSQRRTGRLLVAALLVGAFALTAPAAQAAPTTPPPPPQPSSPSLPAGPWPPSEVLAADPATRSAPEVTAQAAAPCPAAGYGVNRAAPGAGKTVALTFDDGPGTSTAAILQILRNEGVPATFFNIGVNQTVRPALVQQEASQGFLLGNHTWSHPDMATQSSAVQASEMDQATAQQVSLVGSPPCFFRPPYGSYNSTTLSLAQARNMSVWNWSVDTEDWKANGSGDASWVNRIISLAQAGGSQTHPVVLMHNSPAGNPATVAALPTIIKYYRDRGYTFVDLAGGTGNRLPIGHLDEATVDGSGMLRVHGWAIDPDTATQPVSVHVYVDGGGRAITADESRPDVGAVFPEAGSLHGYTVSVPLSPGSHSLCVYAIDTSNGDLHTDLGCRTVTYANRPPIGHLDEATVDGSGMLRVAGWAIDQDTPTQPVGVHVYVDGGGRALVANESRPDVGAVYPAAGSSHGYSAAIPVAPGSHSLCVYAIDTAVSSLNTPFGCRTVTVTNRPPIGMLDSAEVDGSGVLRLNGWAIDQDTPTQPVGVHVYVDGGGRALVANESRPDVGAVYPAAGSSHGYSAAIPLAPGSHSLCVYAIDTAVSWSNTPLGCRTVSA